MLRVQVLPLDDGGRGGQRLVSKRSVVYDLDDAGDGCCRRCGRAGRLIFVDDAWALRAGCTVVRGMLDASVCPNLTRCDIDV